MHRLGAIGCDVIVPTGGHDGFPQSQSVVRIHADFKGKLTTETDAADPGRNPGYLPRPRAHKRKVVAIQIKITAC